MKGKILGLLILLVLVCFSPVVANASPVKWESVTYHLVLEELEPAEIDVRYFGQSDNPLTPHKVLQTFTQDGKVYVDEEGKLGDYLGTITLEVFFLMDMILLKGNAVAKFTMEFEKGSVVVEGVAEARITLVLDGDPPTQYMVGRFSGHGDINMHGTLTDYDGIGNELILEGYAK